MHRTSWNSVWRNCTETTLLGARTPWPSTSVWDAATKRRGRTWTRTAPAPSRTSLSWSAAWGRHFVAAGGRRVESGAGVHPPALGGRRPREAEPEPRPGEPSPSRGRRPGVRWAGRAARRARPVGGRLRAPRRAPGWVGLPGAACGPRAAAGAGRRQRAPPSRARPSMATAPASPRCPARRLRCCLVSNRLSRRDVSAPPPRPAAFPHCARAPPPPATPGPRPRSVVIVTSQRDGPGGTFPSSVTSKVGREVPGAAGAGAAAERGCDVGGGRGGGGCARSRGAASPTR